MIFKTNMIVLCSVGGLKFQTFKSRTHLKNSLKIGIGMVWFWNYWDYSYSNLLEPIIP